MKSGLHESTAGRARLPGQGLRDCTRLNSFIPFILTCFISGFEDKNSAESGITLVLNKKQLPGARMDEI